MKFTFTDKKVNIPNRVHTYAEKKIGKLDRYFQTEPEASIVFSVEKGRNNLEVTIRSASTVIRFAESTSDMFVTIDADVGTVALDDTFEFVFLPLPLSLLLLVPVCTCVSVFLSLDRKAHV